MSTSPMHCTVVRAAPHAIWLPDGTAVHLHRVDTASSRAVRLRALRSAAGWMVIDLGLVAPELRQDLPGAADRDVPALVLRALRRACPTGAEFSALAREAEDKGLTRLVNAALVRNEEAACR